MGILDEPTPGTSTGLLGQSDGTGLLGWLRNNRQVFSNLGAGMAGADNVWQGLGKGGALASQAMQQQQEALKQRQEESARNNATVQLLIQRGILTPEEADALAKSGMLDQVAPKLWMEAMTKKEGPAPTDTMREYEYYKQQAAATGQQPMGFDEWAGKRQAAPAGNYPAGIDTPEAQKAFDTSKGKDAAELIQKKQAAQDYLTKVDDVINMVSQSSEDAFGPVDSSEFVKGVRSINPLWGEETLKEQQRLAAAYADLELSVAQMQMKGQGPVTESERATARQTLGGLKSVDKDTAIRILNDIKRKAAAIASGQQPDTPAKYEGAGFNTADPLGIRGP